ncbi:ATP-grasp domain-containing protein [Aquimarina macrocephali]|uniref:ATP-grasp domain-containing protein n=1 Tax=Aquimarina macrocephali TaxID=666563 RepID=UPI003F6738EA
MVDIVIVTEKACLKASTEIKHSAIAIEEDETLITAFKNQNIICKRVAWEDPNFDWSTTKVALIKSTWNYFHLIPEFRIWLEKVSEKCTLINSKELVLWNMDKHYLLELSKHGIQIPETHLLDTEDIFDPHLWDKNLGGNGFVVKPTISGGSKDTYYLKYPYSKNDVVAIQSDVKRQPMLIQPFIQSIVEEGEISLVFVNGKFTHARVKKPKSNDFRVQPYHGGTIYEYNPTQKEIDFGEEVLEVCKNLKEIPMYARVDFCYGTEGEILLMELEVIEPQLWYPESKLAVFSLIEGIENLI